MSDYFIHNSKMFMPKFKPGINAYGQKGSAGNTGESGSSVYYSSLNIADSMASAIELIKNNKLLSSNLYEDCYGTYKSGDLFVDCVGSIYKLTISDNTYTLESASDSTSSIYNNSSPLFSDFIVYCSTSILKTSDKKWEKDNPYCIKKDDSEESGEETEDETQKYRSIVKYRELWNKTLGGNYVTFTLFPSEKTDITKYSIKFVLALPNGQLFETMAPLGVATGTLYIDNKYLYGCYDKVENCMAVDSYQRPEERYITEGVEYEIEGTIGENIELYGETDKNVSLLFSYFIKRNCEAYAEVTSIETGKTYRIMVDDIFLDNNDDIKSESDHDYYVEKAEPHIIWTLPDFGNGKWISEYLGEDGTPQLTDNREEAFRPFDEYVFFDDISVEESKAIDENEISFFYASPSPKRGFDGYLVDNDFYGDYSQSSTALYWRLSGSSKSNRTHRLCFKNISKITLRVSFRNVTKDGEEISPTSMLYIGVPDCNLVQYGDASVDGDGEFAGVDPGIYYSAKIVPPRVYDPDDDGNIITVPDAGLLTMNINLSDYPIDLGKFHFIDIGITDYGSYQGTQPNIHCPTLEPDQYTDIYGEPCVYTSNATSSYDGVNHAEVTAYISGVEELTEQEKIEGTYYPPEMANVDKPTKIRSGV